MANTKGSTSGFSLSLCYNLNLKYFMKFKHLYTFLFSLAILFSACDKDDDKTNTPIQQTPSSMTAKADGANWKATTTSLATSGGLFTLSGFGENGFDITVRGSDLNHTGNYSSGTITYERSMSGGDYQQWIADLNDSTNVFNITKLDTINKRISGTFFFTTNRFQGSITDNTSKTVTSGVFTDVRLPK